jgi:hypothetical protein
LFVLKRTKPFRQIAAGNGRKKSFPGQPATLVAVRQDLPSPALSGAGSTGLQRSRAELSAFVHRTATDRLAPRIDSYDALEGGKVKALDWTEKEVAPGPQPAYFPGNTNLMKKLVRILGILVVLLVIGLVIVAFSLGGIVKRGVETVGPRLTKTTLTLDKANFSILAGRVNLGGLFVGNPEGFKSESAIKVGELTVQVKPGSVLSDVIEIDEITVKAPEITYEQALTGNNISKLLANVNESTAALIGEAKKEDKAAAPAEPASQKRFKVKLVKVVDARVKVSATMLGGSGLTIPLPEVTIADIGTSGNGVTAGELTGEVLKKVLAGVTKVVAESALKGADSLKDVGKDAGKSLEKAGEGLKNLFKK